MTHALFARHPVTAYFGMAYAASWSIGVPLALQARGVTATHLPLALHYATAFGPALAAFAIARLRGEPLRGRARDGDSIRRGRPAAWRIVGFGSPLLLFAAAQLAARVAGQSAPSWSALGRVNFLPDLGLAAWWF